MVNKTIYNKQNKEILECKGILELQEFISTTFEIKDFISQEFTSQQIESGLRGLHLNNLVYVTLPAKFGFKRKRNFTIYRQLFDFGRYYSDLDIDYWYLDPILAKGEVILNINKYLYQILLNSEFDSNEFTFDNIDENIQKKINEICIYEEVKQISQYDNKKTIIF